MFSYFLKERRGKYADRPPLRWAGTKRGLVFAALSGLALMASACGGGMTFNEAQASFRSFSECAVMEDFPARNLKLKNAWLQNVVAEPAQGDRGTAADHASDEVAILRVQKVSGEYKVNNLTANLPRQPSGTTPSPATANEEYVVTGIVRAVNDSGSVSRDLAILRVRKVLGEYKVVNWATNIDRMVKQDPQALQAELRSKLYLGRCSF